MNKEISPINRLESFLEKEDLPEVAKKCIENFVLSCENITEGNISKFLNIDIRDFSLEVKERLIKGFFYAYTGQDHIEYRFFGDNIYKINLN